jgi:hypothetical protein
VDAILRRRYILTDYFFALPPLQPERLREMFRLANQYLVEVETHPVDPEEYKFLTSGEIFRLVGSVRIARRYVPLPTRSDRRGTTARSDFKSPSVCYSKQCSFFDAVDRKTARAQH